MPMWAWKIIIELILILCSDRDFLRKIKFFNVGQIRFGYTGPRLKLKSAIGFERPHLNEVSERKKYFMVDE